MFLWCVEEQHRRGKQHLHQNKTLKNVQKSY